MIMTNFNRKYRDIIIPKLKNQFLYENLHQVPKIEKIVLNIGLGIKGEDKAALKKGIEILRLISGQQPIVTKSKKAIAGFHLRKDIPVGLKVTLRKKFQYIFLEKLVKIVLPRIKDFRGLSLNSFDKKNNFNIGISDLLIFPELPYELAENKYGINITFNITAKTKNESLILLKEFGFPFDEP